jgi:DNA-binding CsgD family transcriptional regulator
MRYGEISSRAHRRNPGHWPWRSTAAEAAARLGQRDLAALLATEELALATIVGVPAFEGIALRALGLATGGDEGIGLLERAVQALSGSALLVELARAQLALGTALRLAGKRQRSRAPLMQALDIATATGAAPVAQRATDELHASGARPRRTALRGVEALTPSEHRVASLAAQGLTNRQIAQTLFVTTKTVEAHLRASYDKLDVAGKADLATVLEPTADRLVPTA